MPIRVTGNPSHEIEQEYLRSPLYNSTATMEDKSESSSNYSNRQMRQSPPPLIPNSGYSGQKLRSNMPCDNQGNDGSAFIRQFMTAAAAAAMAAAGKKCDNQTRTAEPHSSSNVHENATSSTRRPSSSLSIGPDASPTSTPSSCRSLSGYEGARMGSIQRIENHRSFGDSQKLPSLNSEQLNESDDICVVRDETNRNFSKRSGYSLPLPPGAVPVGTLPHPSFQHASAHKSYGLCTHGFIKFVYK